MFKYIENGTITSVKGIKAAGVFCGLKKQKKDLALIYSDTPATVGGTFTLNKVKAAPLMISQDIISKDQKIKAIIINSGNANACTGEKGYNKAVQTQEFTAKHLGISKDEVLISSTGVIGQQLNIEKVKEGIKSIRLSEDLSGGHDAAEAILTTDTFPKSFSCRVQLSNGTASIGGICKGSGMIMPNMATMLGFIATDAKIPKPLVQKLIAEAVNKSFNRISVDGDTSTNDMVVLLANGTSKISITEENNDFQLFKIALIDLCQKMAMAIVKDGEGATKFISVKVGSAKSEIEADSAARAIVNSLLVKTAINGADANWGRILSAVGNSGIDFCPEKVMIKVGELPLLNPGYDSNFDESIAKEILQRKEVDITVELNDGNASTTWWTCDFSEQYVKINANYRT